MPGHRRAKPLSVEFIDLEEMGERDLIDIVLYWEKVRGACFAPTWRNFKLEQLPPAILGCLVVCDFEKDPEDTYYRYFGSRMTEFAGIEMTGKRYVADKITEYGFINAEIFPVMIEKRAPVATYSRWQNADGLVRDTVSLRLPLSDDGETVTHGVAAHVFK